jgi:hypothetical protein
MYSPAGRHEVLSQVLVSRGMNHTSYVLLHHITNNCVGCRTSFALAAAVSSRGDRVDNLAFLPVRVP